MSHRRRRHTAPTPLGPAVWAEIEAVGRAAGLDALGVTSARPWTATRTTIESRRAEGLAGSMAFTYRNPARSTDPSRFFRGARTLVVGSMSYLQDVPDPPGDRVVARVARVASADHYRRLRSGLGAVADALRSHGARAVVVADDNALVDREAAWRAGLGWYGHNSLILRHGSGSWTVLGSVVTDAALARTGAPVPDGCGPCRRCVTACPTAAIGPDGRVDARRCLAWLAQAPGPFPPEHRVALGDRVYGCDDCQEVCPPNRAVASRTARGDGLSATAEPGIWLDAVTLLALGDDELGAIVDAWYLPGRDVGVVRRNLLVVLGNSGPVVGPGVAEVLARYADGDDALLAEHAGWARGRLGLVK